MNDMGNALPETELAEGDVSSDRIETSPSVIANVMPLLDALRIELGKDVLTVLDPCFCAGQQIKNFAEYPNLNLLHSPEMCPGGALEVCDANQPAFEEMKFDLILTNPPWSAENLCDVLSTLRKLSDAKSVPLLYLVPAWCVKAMSYYKLMGGTKLIQWDMPTLKFIDPTTGKERTVKGSNWCSWYGYNWTAKRLGGNRITVRRLGDDFADSEDDEEEEKQPALEWLAEQSEGEEKQPAVPVAEQSEQTAMARHVAGRWAEDLLKEEMKDPPAKAKRVLMEAAANCRDLPATDEIGANVADYVSICDPDSAGLNPAELLTAVKTNYNIATGKTNLFLVGAYNTACYYQQFKDSDPKLTSDAKALAALKAKGVKIAAANVTYFRQFRKAIDASKAYKFLYGCATAWREVRLLGKNDVLLKAFEQFQLDDPEGFATFC